MSRAAGQKATVAVTFTGSDGTFIPAGTSLYAPETGLQYLTVEDVTITDGTATVQAEAAEIGADYNLPAGYITSYNNNYGLRRGSQPRLFPSQSRSC